MMTETPKLDSRATEQVWRELHADLRRFLRRRVASDELADDLLQEVFLRIHNRIASLDDVDRLHAWVYRIARNVVIDHYRARDRRETVVADPDAIANSAESSEPAGDEQLGAEVARWLGGMVQHLPDTYREAVRLAELEQLPQAEVAQRLGLSLSGAKSRVQRGRQLLKQALLRCCHLEFDRQGNVIDYTQQRACEGCCGEQEGESCS